jgi:cyclase
VTAVEVAAGVWAYVQGDGSWYLNNAGFIVGQSGVIAVDTAATERRTRAYLAAVTAVTDRPVRTLVNTHHHDDHTFGNCLVPGATIVGHERCRTEVLACGPAVNRGIWTEVDWGSLQVAAPFLTYTTGVTLWSDELRCEVRFVGTPAHTVSDSIIHIPERSVVFAGDLLFNGGTPFALGGSIGGAIEVLEDVVRPLGAAIIVPGHGGVCGPEVIDATIGYLRFVQDVARHGSKAGRTPLEAARDVELGEYAKLLDPERIVGNLHRAYAEAAGAARGAAIDTEQAYTEMVAYNGGRPLMSHA